MKALKINQALRPLSSLPINEPNPIQIIPDIKLTLANTLEIVNTDER